ncbi:MAG: GerMN domain-containing protein [Clostridiales bacterium]|nr:GerMN domain-containing protein [Clostridiales bacterium]
MKKRIFCLTLVLLLVLSLAACNRDEEELPIHEGNDAQDKVNEGANEPADEPEDIYYVLYLRHRNLPFIFENTFRIKENDSRLKNKSIEHFVVEQLIEQEDVDDLINPIPDGTKVLYVEREGSTVIVNLSEEFIRNMRGDAEFVEIAVATIVNSLVILPGNEKVRILVDGHSIANLRGADISTDFEFIVQFAADK